jgi:perosamine synthetase
LEKEEINLKPLVKPFIPNYDILFKKLRNVFDSGYIAEGDYVYEFEYKLKKILGLKYALAVNSGTAALHLSLVLLGIKEGDEVISTALTAEPSNTVIKNVGADIVFADVDENTGLISPKSIEKRISRKTKAIMVVHYAGMVCNLEEINLLSNKYNIPVIEDAAHAFMSKYDNKYIGSNSQFTAFSFQAIKQLTTIDGGLLALTNYDDYKRAKKLRWFGLDKSVIRQENNISEVGFKYNMNNVNAAIGIVQLQYLDINIKKSIMNGKRLDKELLGVPGVEVVNYYNNTSPSYWLYTIIVERRSEFIDMMAKEGFIASPLHLRNDRHTAFNSKVTLPNLDIFYERFVHIPCGWWMDEDDISRMVSTIKRGW